LNLSKRLEFAPEFLIRLSARSSRVRVLCTCFSFPTQFKLQAPNLRLRRQELFLQRRTLHEDEALLLCQLPNIIMEVIMHHG